MKNIFLISIACAISIASYTRAANLVGDGASVRSAISQRIATLATKDPLALGEISRKIPLLLVTFKENPADKALLFFIQKEIDLALTPVPEDDELHPGIIQARAEQFE